MRRAVRPGASWLAARVAEAPEHGAQAIGEGERRGARLLAEVRERLMRACSREVSADDCAHVRSCVE